MKSSSISSGISALWLFSLAFLPIQLVYAQGQSELSMQHAEHLLNHSLKFDTIRPCLNIIGKGLIYYDYILPEQLERTYLPGHEEKEKSLAVKASFSDLDMEIMKRNLLFMHQQSRIQIKEMIRKEKWDLNLGEAIKGFYQTPIF